jgi:hypothetical protein
MNAKVKLFRTLLSDYFTNYKEEAKYKSAILFDSLTDEERIEGLDRQSKVHITDFIQQWSDGFSIPKIEYESLKKELTDTFDDTIELGGKEKAQNFIHNAFDEGTAKTFHFGSDKIEILGEARAIPFLFFKDFPADWIHSLLIKEDEQLMAVVLDSLSKHEETSELYEKLRPLFLQEMPPFKRGVSSDVLREIERVIGRKLSTRLAES